MLFIDTHTHLYDEAYVDDAGRDAAVRRAIEAGVGMMIVPDTCSRDRRGVFEICGRWPLNTRPCAGLHPEEVRENWKTELEDALEAIKSHVDGAQGTAGNGRIAAIGEIGLDLHWSREFEDRQEEVLRIQLDAAIECNLPVIIHSRDATEQMFRILEDYRGRGLRGVFHAFSGSAETFRRLERYGDWYVGIGGVLTFKKASIATVVKGIPLERILLETDSPYLTPVPHRGERNESSYIPLIAGFLAAVRNLSIEEIASTTTENAVSLFGLELQNKEVI
ncbi:MAG: TatD family hydrolase [Bacteroidales bacterium]|nr:TatD family hydrolase [Bacteroidales bacterium]